MRFLEADFGNIYPRENAELIKRIIDEGGAVLTEYEINEKPLPINFPRRNRIISGLSHSHRSKSKKRKLNYSGFSARTRKRSFCCATEM